MLIFYGVIMGIGLGVGYLTPVKNLMLWSAKGLATGIAVTLATKGKDANALSSR